MKRKWNQQTYHHKQALKKSSFSTFFARFSFFKEEDVPKEKRNEKQGFYLFLNKVVGTIFEGI